MLLDFKELCPVSSPRDQAISPYHDLHLSNKTQKYKTETDFLLGPVVTRDNGFKMKEGSFRLNMRNKFFTVTVVRHWNRFSKKLCMHCKCKCSKSGWMEL